MKKKIDEPFARVTNRILAALADAPLSATERKVIDYVILHTYGVPGSTKSAPIPVAKIAAARRISKSQAARILAYLISANVLLEFPPTSRASDRDLGMNKHPETWTIAALHAKRQAARTSYYRNRRRQLRLFEQNALNSQSHPRSTLSRTRAQLSVAPTRDALAAGNPPPVQIRAHGTPLATRAGNGEDLKKTTTTTMRASARGTRDLSAAVVVELSSILTPRETERRAPQLVASLGAEAREIAAGLVSEAAKATDPKAFLGAAITAGLRDGSGWTWRVKPRGPPGGSHAARNAAELACLDEPGGGPA